MIFRRNLIRGLGISLFCISTQKIFKSAIAANSYNIEEENIYHVLSSKHQFESNTDALYSCEN